MAKFPYLDRFGGFLPREETGAQANWVKRVLIITRGFCVDVLAEDDEETARRFSSPAFRDVRFARGDWRLRRPGRRLFRRRSPASIAVSQIG